MSRTHAVMIMSITNNELLRTLKGDPSVQSAELYRAVPNGHKFTEGQVCVLNGLENFPEYNGEEVTITSIRADGLYGKAYYVRGRINEVANWIYEYRLLPKEE